MHARPKTSLRSRTRVASVRRRTAARDWALHRMTLGTPTSPSDFAPSMAKNAQGPRQPLSQRRPKAALVKKTAARGKVVAPRGGKALVPVTKTKPARKHASKRAVRIAKRPPVNAADLYDRLAVLYPDAHCELDF